MHPFSADGHCISDSHSHICQTSVVHSPHLKQSTHMHVHIHNTNMHAHARTHAHTHAHTHTQYSEINTTKTSVIGFQHIEKARL